MAVIKLNMFGANLTGRPYGKEALRILLRQEISPPVIFDFEGVRSMGSSFAEELLPHFAGESKMISVRNINKAIEECLGDIESDFGIKVLTTE